MEMKKRMHLGVFFNHTGHHIASWRHPGSQADAAVNLQHYMELAKLAEAACLDFCFFADASGVRETPFEVLSRSAQYTAYFEPITLLTAMSTVTKKIGLVATASTSYYEPYNIARLFASLDHISGGRAGLNVVTGGDPAASKNFGREEHYDHDERYLRATEFIEVLKGLWDSWDDDAFLRDKHSGVFFDPKKVHHLNYRGDFFSVRGPLNCPRPPQGHPVIFQAGFSNSGRELAAQSAEGVFTSGSTFDSQKNHYEDVKTRMKKYGRQPSEMMILPGLTPIIAKTDAEARDKDAYMQSLIHPDVGKAFSEHILEADLSKFGIDDKLPVLPDTPQISGQSRSIRERAYGNGWTIRDVYLNFAGSRGKLTMIGSFKSVADQMQHWFEHGACDGFIFQPPHLPGGLDEIAQLLIPELQDRGLAPVEYQGNSLRDHMGLARPISRWAEK